MAIYYQIYFLQVMKRDILALTILIGTIVAITILSVITVKTDPSEAKYIFNVILPVFASWVGTILAFYFGRENYEAANQQAQDIVQKVQLLSKEQRSQKSVTSIMRGLGNMAVFSMSPDQSEQDIKISDLYSKFNNDVSRLPIISAEQKPVYMIHQSKLDRYIVDGRSQDDTLGQLVSKEGFNFGLNNGFVVVSEKSSLVEAKSKMEKLPSCQDIFITKEGNPDEPLRGWISNIRMAKFLE